MKKINEMILASPQQLISFSERRYYEQLFNIAAKIKERSAQCSILLVSGPSGSTKTTTSQKLSEQLLSIGIHSVVISLDNFFVNEEQLPKLENGDTDYESIKTIDMTELNRCFGGLLNDKFCNFPIFDFGNGCRKKETQKIEINDGTIVIIEGIHALNPLILQRQNQNNFLKLYISPSCDYFFDDEMVLSSRNIRFTRRLIRDFFYRSTPLETTIDMWSNVVKSELVNIMPYKKDATFTIDSTILYEPAIYVYYLEQIIKTNELEGFYKNKIEEVLRALNRFYVLSPDFIPKDTVLHEFLA